MTKTLAAIAALALCGAASAQSSVTVFGVVDVAVSHASNKAERIPSIADWMNPSLQPHHLQVSRTELRNSGLSSSRLGFRGVEDLGRGLSAGFWLESPLTHDEGGGLSAFSRRSTLSLSGGFGELRMGRDSTPTKLSDDQFDPFGATGIGGSLIARAYSQGRVSNSVQYFLPKNLGGVYGNVMYAFHERTRRTPLGADERASTAGQYVGARVGYASGPVNVALAYGRSNGASVSGDILNVNTDRTTKNTVFSVGGSYDFGVAKIFAQYSQNRDERSLLASDVSAAALFTGPNNKSKVQAYLLGVSVPLGAGVLRASYARVNYDDASIGSLWAPVEDRKANKFALGYQYNLSKRTALYATVARISNKNGANLTVGGPSFTSAQLSQGGASYRVASSTGYEFGLRHSF